MFWCGLYTAVIEDKLQQFCDVCSLANISVFAMAYNNFGYYIHGKYVNSNSFDIWLQKNNQIIYKTILHQILHKTYFITQGRHMVFLTQICLHYWSNFKENLMTFVAIVVLLQVLDFLINQFMARYENIFLNEICNTVYHVIFFLKVPITKPSLWRYHQGYGIITIKLLLRHLEVTL